MERKAAKIINYVWLLFTVLLVTYFILWFMNRTWIFLCLCHINFCHICHTWRFLCSRTYILSKLSLFNMVWINRLWFSHYLNCFSFSLKMVLPFKNKFEVVPFQDQWVWKNGLCVRIKDRIQLLAKERPLIQNANVFTLLFFWLSWQCKIHAKSVVALLGLNIDH